MIKGLIHVTEKHTGKMKGIQSISTCCLNNKLCLVRKNNGGTICCHCFAMAQMKRYKNMIPTLERNTEILTGSIIPVEYLPILNCLYFRFESFGDLNNAIQVINYFNICKKNPGVSFALWTKNPWFIKQAIDQGYEKPANLNIIFSSLFTNKVNESVARYYNFIDKVFTVYSKDYELFDYIEINCGSRNCLSCGRCYKKHTGELEYVNELLK